MKELHGVMVESVGGGDPGLVVVQFPKEWTPPKIPPGLETPPPIAEQNHNVINP